MTLFARAAASRNARSQGVRRLWRILAYIAAAVLLLPVFAVVAYRFVPPPMTPLMVIRAANGAPIRKHWVPLARISPALVRAVVASEDEKFCFHHGFDWDQLGDAWKDWRTGHALRGASTISMQTAKNLFLWPGRSFVRKGIEAYITVLLELFWSKQRIIEIYLNVIEWGNGIYGAEAASRLYFGKPASALTPREAALFAAVLPNPRRWSPAHPDAYIEDRAATIRARMPAMAVPSVGGGCR